MEQRVTIITLGVSNLKKSTKFYESKFGWKKSKSSNQYISFFNLNGIQIALFPKDELAKDAGVSLFTGGFNGVTLAYNVNSEKEVDQTINKLKEKGVEVIKEPQKVNWGGYME